MKITLIHIKADIKVKEEAQFIADELGLTLTGVINAFLKQLIRTREVRFNAGNKMTPYLEKIIAESRKDMNKYRLEPMTLEEALDLQTSSTST